MACIQLSDAAAPVQPVPDLPDRTTQPDQSGPFLADFVGSGPAPEVEEIAHRGVHQRGVALRRVDLHG